MAAALFAHSFPFFPVPPADSSTSKSPKILNLAFPLHHAAGSNLFHTFRRTIRSDFSFRKRGTVLKVASSERKTINDIEENQALENKSKSMARQNDNMKALIQAYKVAFLNGDEKSVHEIESSICFLEVEKNELSIKSTDLILEIASAKDKFLRLNADFKNLRKRSEKEHLTFTSDNRAEVIGSLLPIIDNFERVKRQMKPKTERERKIDASYQSIYKQFVEIMRSMSVSLVDTVGRPFDPSIHEAVAREESQQFKPGIVTQELRRGFVITDRVLRPASVKVSSGPGLQKAASVATKLMEQQEILGKNTNQ